MIKEFHFLQGFAATGNIREMFQRFNDNTSRIFIPFTSQLSIGPVANFNSRLNSEKRLKWSKKIYGRSVAPLYMDQKQQKFTKRIDDPKVTAYIWMGSTLDEILFAAYAYYLLEPKPCKILVVDMQTARCSIGSHSPEELFKEYSTKCRPISKKDQDQFSENWHMLLESKSSLRIKHLKIGFRNVPERHYDEKLISIVKVLENEISPVSGERIVARALLDLRLSFDMERFLFYRLKEICKQKQLCYHGSLLSLKLSNIQFYSS